MTAGNGGAGSAEAELAGAGVTSLAALLAGHILRDGETVLLILKPSRWFIAFAALRFTLVAVILALAAHLWLPESAVLAAELAALAVAGRVMAGVLQWMGRLYVLTDLRIVRLAGVFHVDIFDCPLRKVAGTRLASTPRERLLGLGTIEILPADDSCPPGDWRTVRRPAGVLEKINRTIQHAKNGGPPVR